MKILIDGTLLTNTPSGIGIATLNTLKYIFEVEDIVLIVRASYILPHHLKNIRRINIPKIIPRILYIHFLLPLINIFGFYDRVWIPSPRVPLLHFLKSNYYITYYDSTWKFLGKTMSKMQYLMESLQIPFAVRYSRKIFCISNAVIGELKYLYPHAEGKLVLTYMAVPDMNLINQTNNYINEIQLFEVKGKYFLFVGNWEPRKNISNAILGFDEFLNNYGGDEEYYLVIIGKRRADYNLNLNYKNIIFYDDYVSDEVKFKLIGDSIGVIYPSLYEGFGIPILEANLHNKFIVCSDIPVMHEIAKNTAIYVNPLSVNSIAHGYLSLIERSKSNIVACGLTDDFSVNLSRFSWQKTALIILEAINE